MSAVIDALLAELDDQPIRRLADRLRPYLETSTDQPSGLITAAEAAAVLRCKPKRLYELAQRRALPVRRDGGRLLFHRDDLDAYLNSESP